MANIILIGEIHNGKDSMTRNTQAYQDVMDYLSHMTTHDGIDKGNIKVTIEDVKLAIQTKNARDPNADTQLYDLCHNVQKFGCKVANLSINDDFDPAKVQQMSAQEIQALMIKMQQRGDPFEAKNKAFSKKIHDIAQTHDHVVALVGLNHVPTMSDILTGQGHNVTMAYVMPNDRAGQEVVSHSFNTKCRGRNIVELASLMTRTSVTQSEDMEREGERAPLIEQQKEDSPDSSCCGTLYSVLFGSKEKTH